LQLTTGHGHLRRKQQNRPLNRPIQLRQNRPFNNLDADPGATPKSKIAATTRR
jgi:hypothetical protein